MQVQNYCKFCNINIYRLIVFNQTDISQKKTKHSYINFRYELLVINY